MPFRGSARRKSETGKRIEVDGVSWPDGGWLYIAYSINKEDVGVTRVRLKHLQ
jgi:hypothetical protein